VPLVASPLRLSASPVGHAAAPPLLGQHTNEILRELLGLAEADLVQLRASGAVGACA
jgi:formyl-CoA transferase